MLLSELDPAAQDSTQRELHRALTRALAEGWQPWEADEVLKAAARQMGVSLTAAEAAAFIND